MESGKRKKDEIVKSYRKSFGILVHGDPSQEMDAERSASHVPLPYMDEKARPFR